MECEYQGLCKNSDKCYRCYNKSLLNIKKQSNNIKNILSVSNTKDLLKENSWEDLEDQVASKLNNIPTIEQARRSRASGALWFEKGDIIDAILHPECKERTGTLLKTGEKSMSIKKEWLEKAKHEAKDVDKIMCLPFRFKGDDNIYCIIDNDDLMELVTTMKAYIADNERLRSERTL